MKTFLQRLLKFLAYLAAGVVILLAIAVGLFRLFLPRLPEYQDEIKSWASTAIGMQVDFSGMDARWGLSGPQLEFYDTELIRGATMSRVIAAGQVSVGVALTRLLVDRTLVVDRVVVRDTTIEVRQLPDGRWWIQGTPTSELLDFPTNGTGRLGDIEFIAEQVEVQLIRPGDERPTFFDVDRVAVRSDEQRLAVDGSVRLPPSLGRILRFDATQLQGASEADRGWDVTLEAGDLVLYRQSRCCFRMDRRRCAKCNRGIRIRRGHDRVRRGILDGWPGRVPQRSGWLAGSIERISH
jgi:uncharacterized protein YhdP